MPALIFPRQRTSSGTSKRTSSGRTTGGAAGPAGGSTGGNEEFAKPQPAFNLLSCLEVDVQPEPYAEPRDMGSVREQLSRSGKIQM